MIRDIRTIFEQEEYCKEVLEIIITLNMKVMVIKTATYH